MNKWSIAIASVALITAIGVALAVVSYRMQQVRSGPAQTTGEALIGGAFSLTNQNGERVTDATFRGRYMLVYFGFTFCPDICPTELLAISNALDLVEASKAEEIQPIFITVDPERDTVEAMAAYVSAFHTRLIGLTGSAADVREAAQAYRVYYARSEDGGTGEDYTMDHSSFVYLMDRSGRYLAHFSRGTSPEEMAARLSKLVE